MVKRILEFSNQLWAKTIAYAELLWPGEGLKGVPHLMREALRRYVQRNDHSHSDRA